MTNLIILIVGLAILLAGGEILVRGASVLAAISGMSRLLVGLTVVSLGTSAPEFAICLDAAWKGNPEIAVGNIVGSNIANVLLILGLTASFYPIMVQRKILWYQVPIMIGTAFLFLLLSFDGSLSSLDGFILLVTMALFLFWQFKSETRQSSEAYDSVIPAEIEDDEPVGDATAFRLISNGALIVLGCVMLWAGSGWFVSSATEIATWLGISPLVIGLTIVALGSSSPEIVTALMAAKRGFPEMAVGGVIGSNIANLLLVGGATAAVSGQVAIPIESFQFDLPVMLVASIACLPIFASGHGVDRWEGILFLVCYILFTILLLIRPMLSEAFPNWYLFVWVVVAPLILATGFALTVYTNKKRQPPAR